ncbi:TPA: hypothetical protein N0F65_012329 [Lagenidium giganteum]|uniref:Protein kinase domain-containing protein n=1 Tax=Lagenidium giganteum TaxID=4803 RepID=A0AAV2YQ15_9STRA|nr:TPA: hypothetical protein N0F65_012329 [Lagenidium giganteum]
MGSPSTYKPQSLQRAPVDRGDEIVQMTPRRELPGSTDSATPSDDSKQLESVYQWVERLNAHTSTPRRATSGRHISPADAALLEQACQAAAHHLTRASHALQPVDNVQRMLRAITAEVGVESTDPLRRVEGDAHLFYVFGKVIGKGSFGRVQVAKHRLSDERVAIKSYYRESGCATCCAPPRKPQLQVRPRPQSSSGAHTKPAQSASDALEWKRVRQEVKLMASLRPHPVIIQFLEAFETPTQLHVVMEYVGGTSLCDLLKQCPQQRLPERRARSVFRQLCTGIESLHAQNVIHRDLKLENILIDALDRPKVIDFGFSQHEYPTASTAASMSTAATGSNRSSRTTVAAPGAAAVKNFCGTPSYMAPEVVSSKCYDGKAVDVWSLGVILYVLLCGRFPFQGANFHQLYHNIRNQPPPMPSALSKNAQQLLLGIFTVDPRKRLTLAALQRHPWMLDSGAVLDDTVVLSRLCEDLHTWDQGRAMLCAQLERVYGLDRHVLLDAIRSKRKTGMSALIALSMLTAEKYLELVCQRQLLPEPVDEDSTSTGTSSEGVDQYAGCSNQADADSDLSAVDVGVDEADSDTEGGDSHRLQLEKLIRLVKHSLVS